MIGQVYKHAEAFGPAFLPLNGEEGTPPEFTVTFNLPTEDVRTAEIIMGAFARQNSRIQLPVYRFRVFFHRTDELDQAKQVEIAKAILSDLGAGELQAVVGGFSNGSNRYLYVVMNRVHPVTGVPWRLYKDMLTMMNSLRYLERRYGFREVEMPGRAGRGGERFPGGFRGPPDQLVRPRRKARS